MNGGKSGVLKNPSASASPAKRRNLGRSARRRQAKARSIDLALTKLLNGEEDDRRSDSSEQCQLPLDRSHSLPGVLQRRRETTSTFAADGQRLVSQLGYLPGNAVGVVGRTSDLKNNYPFLYKLLVRVDSKRYANRKEVVALSPTTVKLYPLALRKSFQGGKSGRKFKSRKRGYNQVDKLNNSSSHTTSQVDSQGSNRKLRDIISTSSNEVQPERKILAGGTDKDTTNDVMVDTVEPFPTMYWLTHPVLRVLVSQLEVGHDLNVVQAEKALKSSPQFLSVMKTAHESYGKCRWLLLTEEDRDHVENRKWTDAVGVGRGVAGIKNYGTVKCLHTHAAHYLAFVNQLPAEDHDCTRDERIEENLIGKWTLEAVEQLAKERLEGTT